MKSFFKATSHRFTARPTRVGRACKCIVRYVHAQGLRRGDRLPPQDQLQRLLGFSNDTLLAAMRMLVESGGVRRQSGRRGTEIRDLAALQGINWTVGIAGLVAPDSGPGAFYGALLYRLLSRLSRANCRCNTYFRGDHSHWPPHLSDFPGLAGDVADETLDGLVMLVGLDDRHIRDTERHGIPVCHAGFWETMPHAVAVDRRGMVSDAVALFAAQGVRRAALVAFGADQILAGARERDAADGDRVRAALAGCEAVPVTQEPGAGSAIVRQFRARRAGRRPEALILTDDYAAREVAQALAEHTDYRPRMAVATTRQIPLAFALPITRFDLDLDELADRAIATFRQRLLNPSAKGGIEYVGSQVLGPG